MNVEIENTWDHRRAAQYIGCTEGTIRVWCSQRRVPFLKVNRLTRFRKVDLDKWLDRQAVKPV